MGKTIMKCNVLHLCRHQDIKLYVLWSIHSCFQWYKNYKNPQKMRELYSKIKWHLFPDTVLPDRFRYHITSHLSKNIMLMYSNILPLTKPLINLMICKELMCVKQCYLYAVIFAIYSLLYLRNIND